MKNVKIYLDNCCYNRPYDDQSEPRVYLESQAKMLIQDLIKQKRFELTTSTVLDYEISKSPYDDRRNAILQFIQDNSNRHVNVNESQDILKYADMIMETGVKFYDAYHVACAIYGGCDYFISTDKRLLKFKSSKIRIVNPIDFIVEMENKNEHIQD